MNGGHWGFVHCSDSGYIRPPMNLLMPADAVHKAMQRASQNEGYLSRTAGLTHREYWRQRLVGNDDDFLHFDLGWNCGWSDARCFFSMRVGGELNGGGGDKIGLLECWILKRIQDCNQKVPHSWQFEHGFRRGLKDFYSAAGV